MSHDHVWYHIAVVSGDVSDSFCVGCGASCGHSWQPRTLALDGDHVKLVWDLYEECITCGVERWGGRG